MKNINYGNVTLAALRIALGWFFLYSGLTKVMNPLWSAAGYLNNAQTFSGLFQWFAQPQILPTINIINEWGQLLLGISLILGIFVRLSSTLGVALMLLYYFPAANFPFVDHGFIVDEHIIYALTLAYFAVIRAGRVFGLEEWCSNLPICKKFKKYKQYLG